MNRFTGFLAAAALTLLTATQSSLGARIPDPPRLRSGQAGSRSDATITHVLNRLTFGARPGDLDRVQAMGLAAWIDQQLHPSRIDDQTADARLPQLADPPDAATPQERRRFARRQVETLASAKLVRAMYSERQLQEVLVDFWFNHFNVYAAKGRTAIYLPAYERDVIRPHVFDRFRELLEADAKSPAMLFYLDNWVSTAVDRDRGSGIRDPQVQGSKIQRRGRAGRIPDPGSRIPVTRANAKKRPRGLNENYGRELLELHTLGVDGGYTQADVTEVARAFTGWTIDRDGRFRFVAALHDNGEKTVLGHRIKASGQDEGEQVLDILASHPSTAHHIAFELAQRLVADEPPPALVERAAARFRDTGGDLREVVKTIVTSPEFLAPEARGAKFKTPFELVVSAVRTTGAEVDDARAFVQTLQQLGQPLYMCQPPTGYKDTADAWVSAGGLVTRMNFATRLASGNMPGVTLPASAPPARELALKIGSPEFQRF
ncbi:MAG TPA: DUF1800 domain-containing protein [Vicinamibacterales bacterium]|jgi:uncharacterized protein (DUF1800 family)|nr:DUF1800 domain-containing protein [Vicinamibacterales bacterium]